MSKPTLTVIMPTFNRPESLARAARSVFAQNYAKSTGFTLILVDNTPDATATETFKTLAAECPEGVKLICLNEPCAGVANARNTAMQAAPSALIAFLDDDQTAPVDWLDGLIANYQRFRAVATFGPVYTKLPDPAIKHAAYFQRFFARDPGHESGLIDTYYGCGNALIDFDQIPGSPPWFDPKMNETGGEDDVLFRRIAPLDNAYAWAQNAAVFEHPLESRLSLNYTLRRAFSYGQGPVTLAYLATPRRYGAMLFWIMVGAVKAPSNALKWGVLSLLRRPERADALDQMYRACGKIIWFVDVHSYGQAALKQNMPSFTWRSYGQAPTPKEPALKAPQ